MNQKHVMVDIETLGQGSNSVITQLSAIEFDINTGTLGTSFNMFINLESSIEVGLKIEPSTVLWWLNQNDAARKSFIQNVSTATNLTNNIVNVLTTFRRWFNAHFDDTTIMWGRGPRFDFGILTDSYKAVKLEIPWNFHNERCVRTMDWLLPSIKKSVILDSDKIGLHNGLTDAIYQARYVSKIYNLLNIPS